MNRTSPVRLGGPVAPCGSVSAALKFLCDSCGRLVDIGAFSLREGVLELTCPACGLPSRAAAACSDRPASPPGATTGAHEARDQAGPAGRIASDGGDSLPEALEAQWSALDAQWGDETAHEQLVAAAAAAGALGEVGRRYRVRAERGDALAARQRDVVVQAALRLVQRAPTTTHDQPSPTRRLIVSLVFAVGVATLLGWLVNLLFFHVP